MLPPVTLPFSLFHDAISRHYFRCHYAADMPAPLIISTALMPAPPLRHYFRHYAAIDFIEAAIIADC